jgi:hypothetical protein
VKGRVPAGLLALALGLALGGWLLPSERGQEAPTPGRGAPVTPVFPTPGPTPGEGEGEPAAPSAGEERTVQAYDRVVDACGFDVEERCVDGACGAVVAMPDLDRFDGWLRLLVDQPGVVGSTAARDLGLPVAWTSCGDALLASPDVWAAQVGWDHELWCVGDRRACDVAASERYGWQGFGGGVRLTRRVFALE